LLSNPYQFGYSFSETNKGKSVEKAKRRCREGAFFDNRWQKFSWVARYVYAGQSCTAVPPGGSRRWIVAITLDDALLAVWRQTLVGPSKTVQIGEGSFRVRATAKQKLKQVDFQFGGRVLRGLEQIPIRDPNGR
jgi:hypothetical protein